MRILQVFRAPVGGLFRHVADLVRAQADLGHEIGIICDATTGGTSAEQQLAELESDCTLGISRIKMARLPGIGDVMTANKIAKTAGDKNIDVIHGHGAKGGVYARFGTRNLPAKSIYTAHGGTLHYTWNSLSGAVFLGVERLLMKRTDGLVFVCDYERRVFEEKIGVGAVTHTTVHNGLWLEEFKATTLDENPTDILFIGELRQLKGVDVLLSAVARLPDVTATIVGDGPDRRQFEELSETLGLTEQVSFTGALPASEAFRLGRLMVIPSRAESFPYIVLEAIAAQKLIIASDVGGIGEVLPQSLMVKADDIDALTVKITEFLKNPQAAQKESAKAFNYLKTNKTTTHMASEICSFYESLLK